MTLRVRTPAQLAAERLAQQLPARTHKAPTREADLDIYQRPDAYWRKRLGESQGKLNARKYKERKRGIS